MTVSVTKKPRNRWIFLHASSIHLWTHKNGVIFQQKTWQRWGIFAARIILTASERRNRVVDIDYWGNIWTSNGRPKHFWCDASSILFGVSSSGLFLHFSWCFLCHHNSGGASNCSGGDIFPLWASTACFFLMFWKYPFDFSPKTLSLSLCVSSFNPRISHLYKQPSFRST